MNEKLKKEIWKILNLLRGKISSNDYHIILFLSTLQRKKLLENLRDVDPLSYTYKLDELIKGNLIAHNERLEELYDRVYKPVIVNLPPDVFAKITEGVFLIDRITQNIPFAGVFEEILSNFLEIAGKAGIFFSAPRSICEFAISLVDISQKATIYNPFAGLGSYGILVKDSQNYYGQEVNIITWAIGVLRLIAHESPAKTGLQNEDSVHNWYPVYERRFGSLEELLRTGSERKSVDLIISNPPFGYKLNDSEDIYGQRYFAETLVIDQGLDILSEHGKIVCIVSNGVLFRGGTDQKLRKRIVNNDHLEMVISFPGSLLANTSIPFSIIVVNKKKKQKGYVKFVDASVFIKKKAKNSFEFNQDELLPLILANEESVHVKIINNTTISENDFDLSVNQYFLNIENKIKLNEIIDNGRPFNRQLYQTTTTLRRINFSDLNNNLELDYENLSVEEIKKNDFILDDSCFLLGTFNGQLKFSYFQFNGEKHSCSSNMIPLKINEQKVTVPYFAKQLTEGYFIEQFFSYSKGAAIQKVSKTDLLKIVVSLPSIAEQERQEEKILRYFKETNRNLQIMASLEDQLYEQTVYLRHSIAGPTRNILSFMKKMMLIIDNNPNILVAEIAATKLKPTDRYNFNDMRELVERDLKRVENVVKNQLDIQQQISDSKLEPMDIDVFLSDYIHNLGLVHPQINISYKSFVPFLLDDIDKNEYVTINGNKELLSTMLDNLFDNARQHAFQLDTENKFLVNLGYDEDSGVLSIEVANSGKGFPKDIDFKGFIAKNKKSQGSLGNGFGGWYIYQVIKHHKGNLEIDDNSVFKPEIADGYATSFYIQLPLAQE